MKKKLGVLGGMGPMATAQFYKQVIENTVADSDQDHINMVILNHATLPDRTEVILNQTEETFLKPILQDIKDLQQLGVSNIAIPCNTSHYFYDAMQQATDVNIIHMVRETIYEIYRACGNNSKVGLLATRGTVQSGIYKRECEKLGMELYEPTDATQDKVMDIIYGIKGGEKIDATDFEAIIQDLVANHNCNCVIIACTELSLIELSKDVKQYSIDAMKVLVKRSIELSGGSTKLDNSLSIK